MSEKNTEKILKKYFASQREPLPEKDKIGLLSSSDAPSKPRFELRRAIISASCLALVFALALTVVLSVSGGIRKREETPHITESSSFESKDSTTEVENPDIIIANSAQDFISQFSDKSSQTANHDIIFRAINSKKLSFEKYAIQSIYYVPHQDEYGKPSGNLSLDLYWHENDCTSCADYCEKFRLHMIYQKDGIDEAAATKGYSRTETENFFTKGISNNKTSYVFLINSQYYCRYVVNNSIIDKEAVAEQLKDFCLELCE